MSDRLKRALPALIGLALFAAAVLVLRRELHAVTWHELSGDVARTPAAGLALALLLTALNYAILTGYDFLAFAYAGKRLSWERIALASFLAYAVANNVGFAMLSGTSVRYRFYARWGVTPSELSRIFVAYATTFWLGLLLLGGASLATSRLSTALGIPRAVAVPAGLLLMAASLAYVALPLLRRHPIRVRGVELPLPSPPIAAAQLLVSAIDWTLAAAVLYVLLPPSGMPFGVLLGAFVVAQLLGLASHVPGGVGVFEGTMVLVAGPFMETGAVLPALIVYRVVYYLVPLTIALVVLVSDEMHQRRAQAARLSALIGRLTDQLTPPILALFTFLSGVVLLFSGATPAAAGRLALLERILPLGVIEASHFLSSVLGAGLLLLSQGLARRLDAAFVLAAAAMSLGIGASLLKGVDYEEAAILTVVLVILWRARPAFDRGSAFFETRFSIGWMLAVAAALGASIGLGEFAYQHLDYSNQLWWQFELYGEASRFLRGTVGAGVVMLLFAFALLIRRSPHDVEEPSDADLADAARVIAAQTATYPNLVYLRDKAVLFDESRRAFIMYGVQGRTWVALGDPVGPPDRIAALVRLFLERCADYSGVPVFYEVGKEQLHRYADFGLTFVKLGEEARIDLAAFSIAGGRAAKHRQAIRYLEKAGATFRIVEPGAVLPIIDRLRAVSEAWLQEKSVAEKGFSLGFFEPGYLARCPVAVIEMNGEIVAFANILAGAQQFELSVDLMRYRDGAPKEVMEAMFVSLITWGKAQGYRWFSLGMAPLSGFERSTVAPYWSRFGSFLFEHGGPFYNFQGLRAYKEKFHPRWEPRYLVYPGGFRLPRILADVSALVAGGYRKILLKR
ncbi:MAG: bifunctional lysylphosphatidylglycerol flippase/synthetase MprF [Acidobacteriota bacterium]